LPVGKNGALGASASEIDRITGGAISRSIKTAAFKGAAGSSLSLYEVGPYNRVILIGIGDSANSRTALEDFGGRVAIAAMEGEAKSLDVIIPEAAGFADAGALVALGAKLGSYEFPAVGKSVKKHDDRPVRFHVADANLAKTAWQGRWQPVSEGVKLARDLISTPSNIKSPQWYVDHVTKSFAGIPNISVTIIDDKEAARLGMGALVGVAALAENMPDGNAVRPGDVLTTMSGKTMEIINTDAEGRMVLADANWWTQETYKPRLLINIATLTGAARAALGDDYAALFHNNETAAKMVEAAGAKVGEDTWRMPIHASTRAEIKSDVADVKNVVEGGLAGASIGAAFIEEWVKPEISWVHLDIAGVAWANSRKPTIPAGAVGFGVKLFDEVVSQNEGK